MNKLTKEQRLMLVTALDTNAEQGRNIKPIHVHYDSERANIDAFNPSYVRYNKQMYKLLDAGIIARRPADTNANQWLDCYAYIADEARARAAVANGTF
ncbi:hypothetical protein D3C87_848020 [compost metagenome]